MVFYVNVKGRDWESEWFSKYGFDRRRHDRGGRDPGTGCRLLGRRVVVNRGREEFMFWPLTGFDGVLE